MITVVDYGMGNLGSIVNMGRKAGGNLSVSGKPTEIAKARKLILPGVGAFDKGMENLHERGLVQALNEAVLQNHASILGICLGVQLFTRRSQEGKRPGLGWLKADTIRFQFDTENRNLKVPHMGWNTIEVPDPGPMLANLPPDPRFYFVHSYHLVCDDDSDVLAWSQHGIRFAAAVHRGNIWGTQFHPEKSHKYGLAVIGNFIAL